MAAVSFYEVVLWLHITAVVVGFGGTFAYGVRRAQEAAERDIEASGAEVQFGERFEALTVGLARMGAVAGLIIVLTIYVMVAKPFA